ncbi:ComEC family competence protein [Piscirickettsia salmonis]|nr:ComEC family competence protein [Piscirickettsia salmonis]QGP59275.1 ComEC family competence protein [Piscirickettsia salmonis]QGP63977.1 ComEC family competence protein [Piscirickettsia salmonis]
MIAIQPFYGVPTLVLLVFSFLGTLILLMPRGFPGRLFGLVTMLVPWVYALRPVTPDHAFVRVLDVGQGLAVIVKTHHHNLVYDVGNKTKSGFDLGQMVVVPNLYALAVKHIDKLVISHIDSDHSGGLASVLAAYPKTTVISSSPLLPYTKTQACVAGDRWLWDGVTFEFLSPAYPFPYGRNNQSCVLKVSINEEGSSMLLTGDIEKRQEKKLLLQAPLSLKSDILFAPHHGSNSSSTSPFIKAVSPHTVIISAGRYNAYRLPHVKVLHRYQSQHIAILNTGQVGAIDFQLSGNKEPLFTFAGAGV